MYKMICASNNSSEPEDGHQSKHLNFTPETRPEQQQQTSISQHKSSTNHSLEKGQSLPRLESSPHDHKRHETVEYTQKDEFLRRITKKQSNLFLTAKSSKDLSLRPSLARISLGHIATSLGPNRSSLGLNKSPLGLKQSSLGLKKSSLGLKKSSLGQLGLKKSSSGPSKSPSEPVKSTSRPGYSVKQVHLRSDPDFTMSIASGMATVGQSSVRGDVSMATKGSTYPDTSVSLSTYPGVSMTTKGSTYADTTKATKGSRYQDTSMSTKEPASTSVGTGYRAMQGDATTVDSSGSHSSKKKDEIKESQSIRSSRMVQKLIFRECVAIVALALNEHMGKTSGKLNKKSRCRDSTWRCVNNNSSKINKTLFNTLFQEQNIDFKNKCPSQKSITTKNYDSVNNVILEDTHNQNNGNKTEQAYLTHAPNVTEDQAITISSKDLQFSRSLFGEIAFQLERRILNYVFGVQNVQRILKQGYTVKDIIYVLGQERVTHSEKNMSSHRRLVRLLTQLERFGYDLIIHGEFSVDIINQCGMLADTETLHWCGHVQEVRTAVNILSESNEEREMMVTLLESLCHMAKKDKCSLFVF